MDAELHSHAVQGLRIVDAACDASLEHAERELRLWDIIDKCADPHILCLSLCLDCSHM